MSNQFPDRSKAMTRIHDILNENISQIPEILIDKDDIESLAKNLEETIYVYITSKETTNGDKISGDYKRRYINLMYNLQLKHNKHFLKKILTGEITFDALSKISLNQFHPEYYQIKEKEKQDRIKAAKRASEVKKGTLQCGKCKSWKTEYTSVNQRSADEPPVVRAICLNCDHRWKFS